MRKREEGFDQGRSDGEARRNKGGVILQRETDGDGGWIRTNKTTMCSAVYFLSWDLECGGGKPNMVP